MTECPQPSWFNDKKHPLWPIIKMGAAVIALNVTALTVILMMRANKFDADELKNIVAFAGTIVSIFGGGLAVYNKVSAKKSGDETDA